MLAERLAFQTLFKRQAPRVRLLDFRNDVADLTTYTFTGVNVGDHGSTMHYENTTADFDPQLRTPGMKALFIIVHAEDAAITFGITSVRLGGAGGVLGQEQADRGGGTSAINTGIYRWLPANIQGITSTDVIVTMSEAVT